MEFPLEYGKSISESGINNIGWRGLLLVGFLKPKKERKKA